MATKRDLERILEEKSTWVRLYDQCTECLDYLKTQFGGKNESGGGVCFRLTNMRTGLSGGGFWQGPDAESFSRRLEELSNAFRDSEESLRQAIEKIQKKAKAKTEDCNARIRYCYDNMDDEGKAELFLEAYWQTIKDLFT